MCDSVLHIFHLPPIPSLYAFSLCRDHFNFGSIYIDECIVQPAAGGSLAGTAPCAVGIAAMGRTAIMKQGSVRVAVGLDTTASGVTLVSWHFKALVK